jgi:hypothetical protein
MAYLIQTPSGDQLVVFSLEGHEDCTVLDANSGPMTLDAAKQLKRSAVDVYLYMQFLCGFTPSSGPLGGNVLQVRDDTDRTNWLTSKDAYRDEIDAGNGAVAEAEFRTAANETVTVTYQEGFDALQEMAAWGKSLMKKSWTLKDQIDALTDEASVLAYDVAAQWAALQ